MSELLDATPSRHVPLVVAYLSGVLPQGKIGVGYSLVGAIEAPPASKPTLALADVDETFTRLSAVSGAGSQARRRELLADLMEKATGPEQAMLRGLVLGELRQGASAGIMEEAIARTAGVPVGTVRRAAMVSGDLAAVGASGGGVQDRRGPHPGASPGT